MACIYCNKSGSRNQIYTDNNNISFDCGIPNSNTIIDKEILDKIQKAGKKSLDIFNKSINSFFKKDIKESNENIEEVYELERYCDEINEIAQKQEEGKSLTIGYITDSLRRIAEYSQDISENVINYLISDYSIKK